MASIEIGPLSEYLDDEEINAIRSALGDADIDLSAVDDHAESRIIVRDLDDDMFVDFLDRLEANDASCDIYVPADFEFPIDGAGYSIGSSHALLNVLDELRDEFLDEDEADEDEDEDYDPDDIEDDYGPEASPRHLKDEQLSQIWKLMVQGARASVNNGVFVFVRR